MWIAKALTNPFFSRTSTIPSLCPSIRCFNFGIARICAIIFLTFFICTSHLDSILRGPAFLTATADGYEGRNTCSICVHGQGLVSVCLSVGQANVFLILARGQRFTRVRRWGFMFKVRTFTWLCTSRTEDSDKGDVEVRTGRVVVRSGQAAG